MNKILAATCVVVFGSIAPLFAPKTNVRCASPSKLQQVREISPVKVMIQKGTEQKPRGSITVRTLSPAQLAAYQATLATQVKTDYALGFVDGGFETIVDNQ